MTIRSGRTLFGDESHGFYKTALPKVPPSLMLDIGAAIGGYTRLIRQNNPLSRVASFEPFEGNWEHFDKRIGADLMVTFYRCAVSDTAGMVNFFVSSTVKAKSGFWSAFPGSSSMGAIVDEKSDRTYEVETVVLDQLFDEPIHFMKVDVQGSEENVLRGCDRLWRERGIEIMSIEFSGKEPALLNMLLDRGYSMFDTQYCIILKKGSDLSDWDVTSEAKLSTGSPIVFGWPKAVPSNPSDYMAFMDEQRNKAGNCWTDLICVSEKAERWISV